MPRLTSRGLFRFDLLGRQAIDPIHKTAARPPGVRRLIADARYAVCFNGLSPGRSRASSCRFSTRLAAGKGVFWSSTARLLELGFSSKASLQYCWLAQNEPIGLLALSALESDAKGSEELA